MVRDYLDAMKHKAEVFPRQSGAGLHLFDFASGMDTGDGMHWPGSDVSDIVSDFGPGPERSFPGSGGIMKFPDVLGMIETEPGNLSSESGVVFIWSEFGDMAPGIMACPCLPTVGHENFPVFCTR